MNCTSLLEIKRISGQKNNIKLFLMHQGLNNSNNVLARYTLYFCRGCMYFLNLKHLYTVGLKL